MFQFQVLVHLPTTPITAVAGTILSLRVKSVSIVFIPDGAQNSTLFEYSNDYLIQQLWSGDDSSVQEKSVCSNEMIPTRSEF